MVDPLSANNACSTAVKLEPLWLQWKRAVFLPCIIQLRHYFNVSYQFFLPHKWYNLGVENVPRYSLAKKKHLYKWHYTKRLVAF
jgi:hypothetical protein